MRTVIQCSCVLTLFHPLKKSYSINRVGSSEVSTVQVLRLRTTPLQLHVQCQVVDMTSLGASITVHYLWLTNCYLAKASMIYFLKIDMYTILLSVANQI